MDKALKSSAATKAAIGVMGATFLIKFLGFIREVLIGTYFGATYQTDAYIIATTIPMVLFVSVLGAISTSFIPVYSKVKVQEGEDQGILFTNKLLNIILIISLIITILGEVFTRPILSLIAMGFDERTMLLAVQLTRITFPMLIFIGFTQIYAGFSQSNGQYIAPAMVNLPNHLFVIAALVISGFIGIKGVAYAVLVGAILQVVFQVPWIYKKGYNFKFVLDIKDHNIKHMGHLVVPVLIGTSVQQLNTLIDRMLASGLVEGSISALNFSNKLNQFMFGIVSISIATVIYPMLSEFSASNDIKNFKKTMASSLNVVTVITIPLVVGVMVLREPIIRLLFERGEFDQKATMMTASALLFYALGMLFFGYRDILNRVYYSLHDTKTPMLNGTIALGSSVIFNLILVRFMGHNGLALGTSIASIITSTLLFYNLRKKIGGIDAYRILNVGMKCLISSLFMGGAIYFTYQGIVKIVLGTHFLSQLIQLGCTAIVGIIIYTILIYLFKVEELRWIVNMTKKKFKSKRSG